MIQGKLIFGDRDINEVYDIRRTVFVHELNYPEEFITDQQDKEAIHVLVYEKNDIDTGFKSKTVATGRIIYQESYCEIDKIAVLKEFRHKAYGDFTVRMLLNKAFTAGIHEVKAKVNLETVDFFKKIGFMEETTTDQRLEKGSIIMRVRDTDMRTCCMK